MVGSPAIIYRIEAFRGLISIAMDSTLTASVVTTVCIVVKNKENEFSFVSY